MAGVYAPDGSLRVTAVGGASGLDLDDIGDVVITGPIADNEVLAYDTGTSKFINQTAAEAGISAGAPADATYITQTANGSLSAEQALSSLSTGLMKVTTTTGVVSSIAPGTGVETAIGMNVGTAGSLVINGGALGTPSSGTLTSATGLPVSTGISGLGTGVATALAVNTGSAGAPVLFNGAAGTPSSLVLTNATGLPNASVIGLGSAALVATGTSGATIPLLSAANTWTSGVIQKFGSATAAAVTAFVSNFYISTTSVYGLVIESTATSGAGAGSGIMAASNDGAALASGDRLGYYSFGGSVSASAVSSGPFIFGYTTEAWSATTKGNRIAFSTTPNTTATLTERWSIGQDGGLTASTDNSWDIGASGATRPRTVYVGTSVIVPTVTAATSITTPSLNVNSGGAVTALFAGTYTPTLTNTLNVAASTAHVTHYQRIGNEIHVSGRMLIDPTTTLTQTQVDLTLPVVPTSNFASSTEAGGICAVQGDASAAASGTVYAVISAKTARLDFRPTDVTNAEYGFSFVYTTN